MKERPRDLDLPASFFLPAIKAKAYKGDRPSMHHVLHPRSNPRQNSNPLSKFPYTRTNGSHSGLYNKTKTNSTHETSRSRSLTHISANMRRF